MKTTDIKIAFFLILIAAFATISLTCCNNDKQARMLWTVSTENEENVDISFDATRRPQIEIIANNESGECRISCPNFQNVSFRERDYRANVYEDYNCKFHAEISAPGVITINFDQMAESNLEINTYFMIDGDNGTDMCATVVKVTRKLYNIEIPHSKIMVNHLANISF